MPLGKAVVRLRGVGQLINPGNRDLPVRRFHCPAESLELADSGDGVVGVNTDLAPFFRFRLDAVRISKPPAGSNCPDADLQRSASRQREHAIDAVGREAADGIRNVSLTAIYSGVRAAISHERHAVLSGRSRKHTRAAAFRELDRQSSHPPGAAVNDDGFASPDMQSVVDALERGQPGGRDRACLLNIQSPGNVSGFFRRDSDVLGVEAALGLAKL